MEDNTLNEASVRLVENLIFGYRATATIGVSIEAGVLDAIGTRSISAADLAVGLGIDQEWVDQITRALKYLGVLGGTGWTHHDIREIRALTAEVRRSGLRTIRVPRAADITTYQ